MLRWLYLLDNCAFFIDETDGCALLDERTALTQWLCLPDARSYSVTAPTTQSYPPQLSEGQQLKSVSRGFRNNFCRCQTDRDRVITRGRLLSGDKEFDDTSQSSWRRERGRRSSSQAWYSAQAQTCCSTIDSDLEPFPGTTTKGTVWNLWSKSSPAFV